MWALVWSGMGILWLLPANRVSGSISSAISGAVGGEPGWLAHVQLSVAHALGNGGGSVAVACARPLLRHRARPVADPARTVFLVAGAALALDYWMFGEAFGQPFSGIATDPNTGPLLVLLALALSPNRVRTRSAAAAGTPGAETAPLPAPVFSLSG